ncbi:MAG: nuclear transport factor 2 family protein [Gaiellaceae bacterium]
MEHNAGRGVPESERLARRYFALFTQGEVDKMLDLIHPEIEMVLKTTRPGDVLRGKDDVAAFVQEIAGKFYESVPEVFRPIDDTRIVIEGRMRWMDDARVLRDDPMIWALEFRDGLVWRSTPAHSVLEAESILAAPRS